MVQIRAGIKVLKPWYGCLFPEQETLSDLFQSYAAGILDNSSALPDAYMNTGVSCSVGKSKQELISTSCSVQVGIAVSTLGCYIVFSVAGEVASRSSVVNAATVLMQAAKDRFSVPKKWSVCNSKLKMKNDMIDWLVQMKLGWEPAYAQQLGTVFINTLVDALWYIDGNDKTLEERYLARPENFNVQPVQWIQTA